MGKIQKTGPKEIGLQSLFSRKLPDDSLLESSDPQNISDEQEAIRIKAQLDKEKADLFFAEAYR